MQYIPVDTENIMRTIVRKVGEGIGADNVLLTNPSQAASFPCCVVQPPLQRPQYMGAAWTLSITVEVWSGSQYESMRLFDEVKAKLLDLNFQLTNNTPLHQDKITEKWRYGGYFECLYDAVHNAFIQNR